MARRITVYGSAEDCDVRILDDPYVSPHHAAVAEYQDGRALIADGASTNGTWLGRYLHGVRVYGPTPIADGQVFTIGRTEITWQTRGGWVEAEVIEP